MSSKQCRREHAIHGQDSVTLPTSISSAFRRWGGMETYIKPERTDVSSVVTKNEHEPQPEAGPSRPRRHRKPSHRYRGRRAASFTVEDVNELIEIRARQRTFDGAYARTALGTLGYAVTILRLFDKQFYHMGPQSSSHRMRVGLLYTILSGMLFIISYFRERKSLHDFADRYRAESLSPIESTEVIKTVGQTGKRIYGRPFRTAGWVVVAVTIVVGAVEVGLLALTLKLDI